jgi:hypothetical protein
MFIDSRGRLFGRINLVDMAVVAFVVALLPMSYVAYRVFRIPPPEILSVSPTTLTAETPRRLKMTGRHFRPYLGAFVAKNGAPFSLNRHLPIDSQQATFLVETPDEVELALPPIEQGVYDIHLYDEALEVASFPKAFVVAPLPRVTIEALVQFVVPPALVPLVKEGDRDLWEQAGAAFTPGDAATLGPVRVTGDPVTLLTGRTQTPGTALETTVRIPAKARSLGGWEYKGDVVRAGNALLFETASYRIYGVIERVTESPAASMSPNGGK